MIELVEPVVTYTVVAVFVCWAATESLGLIDRAFDRIADRKR